MSINLVFKNGTSFRVLDNLSFSTSNTEVTFQDIVLDFTGHTVLDIPYKYQECSLVKDDAILFTGFISEVSFNQMQMSDENRELHVTLLSPMSMATIRTVTLIGTYTKYDAIMNTLQPLIDDGFILDSIDIPEGQITCNYLIQSIEFIMNELCSKLNLFWHIDENKKIYIQSIETLFLAEPKANLSGKIDNLLTLQPLVENIDYANVINIKKARLYYFSQSRRVLSEQQYDYESTPYSIIKLPLTIKKGDTVTFDYPLVINEDRLKTLATKNIADYWRRGNVFL